MSVVAADIPSMKRKQSTSFAGTATRRLGEAFRRAFPWAFSAVVIAVLAYGWSIRDYAYINAEEGLGYWLGIAGGVGMLLQLGYTMRKKVGWMRHLGKVRWWFIVHMMMGILAPTLILFHANFSLGSLNSNVALFSMLVVVASGIVGRFIYSKIHRGLNGRQLSLESLYAELADERHAMQALFAVDAGLSDRLDDWRRRAVQRRPAPLQFVFLLFLPLRLSVFRFELRRSTRRALDRLAREQGWTARERRRRRREIETSLRRYVQALRSVAGFAFYTRLFALWHVLHIPLFAILFVSACFHVVAVHMY